MYIDTSNAQNLKEKLLLSAVNEFAEYGYEGARVDNIVKAADCSKQTVYHHFGNKENLFIEVLEYTERYPPERKITGCFRFISSAGD